MRLDHFLQIRYPEITRSQITRAIKDGGVTVNGQVQKKCGAEIHADDMFNILTPMGSVRDTYAEPQDIPLDIIYEDEFLMIINKPRGMVTHPGAGNHDNTLLNALLNKMGDTHDNPTPQRGGIVHRLDKNTAGLMVVAKDITTQGLLSGMLERHEVARTYLGIVDGIMAQKGIIDKKIIRDPNHRTLFTTDATKGRRAITHFETLKTSQTSATKSGYSLCKFILETGRTHQIRVHCKSIGHPLVGDPEYNPKSLPLLRRLCDDENATGQLLESVSISFIHPRTTEKIAFEIKPSELFETVAKKLF
jgi:23S rRNA pseudouridine1911/1915/1917 synthase